MGSLTGSSVYLIGPIDRAKDGGETWRHEATPWLKELGIRVLNPIYKPFNIGIEDKGARIHMQELRSEGKFDEIRKLYGKIRTTDLRMVDIADFVIVQLDLSVILCGTMEELFWSNRMKKPTLIWCPQGIRKELPFWLILTFPAEYFFDTLNDVRCYLKNIDDMTKDEVNQLDRWLLINGGD